MNTKQPTSKQSSQKRLRREQRTVQKMITLYCTAHHNPPEHSLCTECQSLLSYATLRIENCPFGALKPTCDRCTIHCYKPEMQENIKQVMRYAGPRMMLHHPWLAILHLVDRLRKQPQR
jgi:hypothetical protein